MIELARRRMMMGGSALPAWLTNACNQYSLPVDNMLKVWNWFPELQYVFEPNSEGKYLYLCSPNENARIDTGIRPTSSESIYCEGQIFKFGSSDSPWYYVSNRGSYSLALGNEGWNVVNSNPPYPNSFSIENGVVRYRNANGTIFFTKTYTNTFTSGNTVYLFSWHNLKESLTTMIHIFWFKTRGIFLVPFLNPIDNKYCMLDVNSMKLYMNIGTVDFEIRYI